MDLKIKDVAELLHVSEITIRRWITSGQIPAYRLNHQYRFSRLEIENWMMSCKLKTDKDFASVEEGESELLLDLPKAGSRQFSLFRAVHQGAVLIDVPGSSKEEIIRSSAQMVSSTLGLDADLVAELLLDRERLMSTALNHGIAVPLSILFIFNGIVDRIVVAFPKNPVDFGALDGMPVHTLFFLFSSQDKNHLQLLSKVAHLASQIETQEFLRSKPSKESLLAFIKSWEAQINK